MAWLLVSSFGFVVETMLIIALARGAADRDDAAESSRPYRARN